MAAVLKHWFETRQAWKLTARVVIISLALPRSPRTWGTAGQTHTHILMIFVDVKLEGSCRDFGVMLNRITLSKTSFMQRRIMCQQGGAETQWKLCFNWI